MINSTAAYKSAVVGSTRHIKLRAVVDIIDPDLVFGVAGASGEAPFSNTEQLHNKEFETSGDYITLETNRWLLNGDMALVSPFMGEVGYVSDIGCDADGNFSNAPWVELRFSGVDILQACSFYFPNKVYDGIPVDFTVEVKQGGVAYYSKSFTNNTQRSVSLTGFTVYNPDAIRITATRWSLPGRRMRIPEIIPGVYEVWSGDDIADFSMKQQGDVSCVSLPYGTCELRMDNLNRRFEPRNKAGIFNSIEERQGIEIKIGVELADGDMDWKDAGVYYQNSTGWKTGDNDITMRWSLIDIIGLVSNREFMPPASLPTTLGGWLAAIVGQLGDNFVNKWSCDPAYINAACTTTADKINGIKCGDLLRYVCMATGTWARADAKTGYLCAEPMWNEGGRLDLDNMNTYPVISANDDIAAIIFTLDNDVKYVVSGNAVSADKTVSISNPFIHNTAQALTAARNILSSAGGNQLQITGRGDPASEIGDVDTVELDESNATTGRRIYQTFEFHDGVMQSCKTTLLQADGVFMFDNRDVITENGVWVAPPGVTSILAILCGGGSGGMKGEDGSDNWNGEKRNAGASGSGGRIWYGTINVNNGQSFAANIGQGGAASTKYGVAGESGGATTFGAYSSENGVVFSPSYTDIASGDAFGRSGVKKPIANTADGGAGGSAGRNSVRHMETSVNEEGEEVTRIITDSKTVKGGDASPGASGCVIVYYSKPNV